GRDRHARAHRQRHRGAAQPGWGRARMTRIAVLGLGEAGSLIAADLARAGAVVRGYDPRVRATGGVIDAADAAQACRGADLVLSVNSAADALDALRQGLPGCPPG